MESTLNTSMYSNDDDGNDDDVLKAMDMMLYDVQTRLTRFSLLSFEDRCKYYQHSVHSIYKYFTNNTTSNNNCSNRHNDDTNISEYQPLQVLQVIANDLIKFSDSIDTNLNYIRANINIIPIILSMSSSYFRANNEATTKPIINEIIRIMSMILSTIGNSTTEYLVYDVLMVIYYSFQHIPINVIDAPICSELLKRIDSMLVAIYSNSSNCSSNNNNNNNIGNDNYVVELVLGSLSILGNLQPRLLCDYTVLENGTIPKNGILLHVTRYMGHACIQGSGDDIHLDICRNILNILHTNMLIDTKTLKDEITVINKQVCTFLKTSKDRRDSITRYWNNWMRAIAIFVEILPSKERSTTILDLFNTKKKTTFVTQLSGVFEDYSKKEYSIYLASLLLSAVQTITPIIKAHDPGSGQCVNDWLSKQKYLNLVVQIFRCLNRLVVNGILDNDDCTDQLIEKVIGVLTTMADCCWLTITYSNSADAASIFHIKYKSSRTTTGDANDPRYPDRFIDLLKYILELRDVPGDKVISRNRLMLLQKGIACVTSAIFKNGEVLVTSPRNDIVSKEDILNRGLFAQQASSPNDDVKVPNPIVIIEYIKMIELSFIMLMWNSSTFLVSDTEIVLGLIRSWQIGLNSLGRIVNDLPDEEICNTYDDGMQHKVLNKFTSDNKVADNINEVYKIVRRIWALFWSHSCNMKLELWRGLFLESFWWYLHRMSGYAITMTNDKNCETLKESLYLHDVNNRTPLLMDSIVDICPNCMVGFALILTIAHGRIIHMQEEKDFRNERIQDIGATVTIHAGKGSLNLLKWAVYRSVKGMLESLSLLPILRFVGEYVTSCGMMGDDTINKIHSKTNAANKFVIFERSVVTDDRFNIGVICSIISSTLTEVGKLKANDNGSQSQQLSQPFQQSPVTPLTPVAETEMIEGFKLFLGIPLILMSVGYHVHQCIVVPEKPWSDISAKNNDNSPSPSYYWKKLFIIWLSDLYRNHLCEKISFHTSVVNQYGGVIITGKRSPSLSLSDFKTGTEILSAALDVLEPDETEGRLPSQINETIGFNLYQAWVNLMMSWTNVMSLGYDDMCDVDPFIADPQHTLSPLLSILIAIVRVFGDHYILPEKSITIYKDADDEIDNDSDDVFSTETSSLRAVLSSLFQLPVSITSPIPTQLTYINASTIAKMRSLSSMYVITILETLIKLEEELSARSQSKVRDILGHDLIKKVATLIDTQRSNSNENETNLINACILKLREIIGADDISPIGINNNNNDDDGNVLGKRKSIDENCDSKSIKRNKVVQDLNELMSDVKDLYECDNCDNAIKVQALLQNIKMIIDS